MKLDLAMIGLQRYLAHVGSDCREILRRTTRIQKSPHECSLTDARITNYAWCGQTQVARRVQGGVGDRLAGHIHTDNKLEFAALVGAQKRQHRLGGLRFMNKVP